MDTNDLPDDARKALHPDTLDSTLSGGSSASGGNAGFPALVAHGRAAAKANNKGG